MIDRKRAGRSLFRCWALASVVYVIVAVALSIAPVRSAIAHLDDPPVPAPAGAASARGPLPDAPDSPQVKLAKTVAKQAALTLAPPLLVLWFGWDLWFAAVGFLSRDRRRGRDREPDADPPA